MRPLRGHARLTGWIAVLAVLLASLAPSLSRALAPATASSWIEVCTAEGTRWTFAGAALAADAGSERTPTATHVFEHCPYCSLHTPTLGLPPATAPAHGPSRSAHERPSTAPAAAPTRQAWVSAQPRAPPQSS